MLSLQQEGSKNRQHWNKFWRQTATCGSTGFPLWSNRLLKEQGIRKGSFYLSPHITDLTCKTFLHFILSFWSCWTVFMAGQNCWICIYFQYSCSMLGVGLFHRHAWSGSERTFSDINLECLGAAATGTAPTSVCKCCCQKSWPSVKGKYHSLTLPKIPEIHPNWVNGQQKKTL